MVHPYRLSASMSNVLSPSFAVICSSVIPAGSDPMRGPGSDHASLAEKRQFEFSVEHLFVMDLSFGSVRAAQRPRLGKTRFCNEGKTFRPGVRSYG